MQDIEEMYVNNVFFEQNIGDYKIRCIDTKKLNEFVINILKDEEIVFIRKLKADFWMKKRIMKELLTDIQNVLGISINYKISLDIQKSYNVFTRWLENSVDSVSNVNTWTMETLIRDIIDVTTQFNDINYISQNSFMFVKNYIMYTTYTLKRVGDDGNLIEIPIIVGSDGSIIQMIESELVKNNIFIKDKVVAKENRWSFNSQNGHSFRDFIKHKTKEIQFHTETWGEDYKNTLNPTPLSTTKDIYQFLKTILKSYIEFDEEELYDILAIWMMGTYLHQIFNAYPYIFLNGVKASGKTKIINIAEQVCFNAINTNNISSSAMFRTVQVFSPSVLIDEAEAFSNKERQENTREMLLSGYKKGTRVPRVEESKDEQGNKIYVVKFYNLFSPKMLANIQGMEEVLESRCIKVITKPALNQTVANKEIELTDKIWQDVRDKLYWFMMEYWNVIEFNYRNLENDGSFKNREWELWKPILSIAKLYGESEYEKLKEYASEAVIEDREKQQAETNESILLNVLIKLVDKDDYYQIRPMLVSFAESLEYNTDKLPRWLSSKFIGKCLRRLGFKDARRVSSGMEFFIKKSEILTLKERFNIKTEEEIEREEKLKKFGGDSNRSMSIM